MSQIGASEATWTGALLLLLTALCPLNPARADDFDQLAGSVLRGAAREPGAKAHTQLTMAELAQMPNVLRDTRAALILTTTNEGNLARILASVAFRKPNGPGDAVPILILERFNTFDGSTATSSLARGRDLTLFDGFRFDLDTGQVVPDGHGADLQFLANGDSEPRLIALDQTKLLTVNESPVPKSADSTQPSPGRNVVPSDFQGRYRLFANGRTSGWLELTLADANNVKGRFLSDQSGSSFRVTGQISPEESQKIHFAIEFPRVRQEFEGRLFNDGKGAIAGTMVLLDHSFGFFAIRDKGRIVTEGDFNVGLGSTPVLKHRVVVHLGIDESLRMEDQQPLDLAFLKQILKEKPDSEVVLKVADGMPFGRLQNVLQQLSTAEIKSVRLSKSGGDVDEQP